MPKQFSKSINTHQYPEVYYKVPVLLRLQHFYVLVTTLRNWYVKHTLSGLLRDLHHPFCFLDAGCGGGDFLLPYAKQFPGSRFAGIDRNSNNIRMCRHYIQKYNINNTDIYLADLENWKSNIQFDMISCITALQYIKNDTKVLRSFYEGLKSGGRLLLYVPVNYTRIFPFYDKLIDRYFRASSYDIQQNKQQSYTSGEIIDKLTGTGYTIKYHKNTYGFFGKLYYEIYSLLIHLTGSLPALFLMLLTPLFLGLILPVLLILMLMDVSFKIVHGNGLLVVAEKQR